MDLITQRDWLSIQIQIDETTVFVQKQQLMVQWLNRLGIELNDLPVEIAGLVDAEKQAAVNTINSLLESAQQFAEACSHAAGESRTSVSQMQGLTESFVQSLSDSAASNRAEINAWIAEIEQVAEQAQAAAAGDVINNFTVSSRTAWGSARTSEYARQQAVAMAMVLG